MAYASLVSLEHTSGLILNHDKYSASFAEREQITSILEYVSFLISFLEDLPEKAKRLEGKIMDLAHKAEDLMEYHMWNQCQTKWPLAAAGPSKNTYERQLKEVREKIGSLTGEMMEDRASVLQFHHHHGVGASRKDDVVIGLDADLLEIKGQLYGESSKLEVIPIVGMGGIGKTALAQHLYDDPLIVGRFDIRVWVTVSQDYSFDQILQNLLYSINEQMLGYKNESLSNAEIVYRSLKGRRYLIVMDDIWSTNAWDAVRYIFPDDNNGSRIMLTTRLSDVASYASSGGPVHEMKFMDEKQSWNLLKHRVFTDDEECSPELEDIGKGIARGCRGLPLAVVLVAGVLSTMVKTRASWEKIAKDLNAVFDEQCDKILSLSYMFLPHHLRPCFLFLAAFPEDHNIQVSRLVKLWVAEGFLRQCNGNNRLEEEAEGYLEDLVKRSLVLVASRKSNGKMKSCRVHDLVRDMCIRIAQEEKFLVAGKYVVPSGSNEERRISIGRLNRLDMIRCPTVHTILCMHRMNDTPSPDLVVNFRLLRVLEVIHNRQVFHPAVFKLFHLRYLAVRISNENLQGISNLENLQTLILYSKYYALRYWDEVRSYLPLEIWRMQQLRHLVLPNGYGLPMPADVLNFPLHNLQTLSGIPSSQRKRIFEMIPNLKKMDIIHTTKEHNLHNLENLQHLEKLKLVTPEEGRYPAFLLSLKKLTVDRGRPGSHFWEGRYPAFPLSLKKLTVDRGRLPWEIMSIVGSLPNLEVLKLRNNACHGNKWETTDGKFTQLKYVLIQNVYLEHWITEGLHFPTLKSLVVRSCLNLKEIPTSIGDIPTLELIDVTAYQDQESLVDSVKQIQDDQLSYGNDTLQVRCKIY